MFYKQDEVCFCTKCIWGGIKHHCHPNFCNKGPFYNWMLVSFTLDAICPYKLIAVIPSSMNNFDGCHLIVQSCEYKGMHSSVLFADYFFLKNCIELMPMQFMVHVLWWNQILKNPLFKKGEIYFKSCNYLTVAKK